MLLNPYDVLKALTSNGPVRRWLEFVAHEYEPPDGKEVLLLYPCSAVKPYSQSRLYRVLYTTLNELGPAGNKVHVVSVSEPFGLVPEDMYPRFDEMGWYDCPGLFKWWCTRHGQPYDEEVVQQCIDLIAKYVATFLSRTKSHYVKRIAFVRTMSSGLRRLMDHTHANIVERASKLSGVHVELLPPRELVAHIVRSRGRLAWDFYGVAHPIAQEFLVNYLRKTLKDL